MARFALHLGAPFVSPSDVARLVFPGIPRDVRIVREQVHAVSSSTALSGKEWRSTWSTVPRYKYTLVFNALFSEGYDTTWQQLVSFVQRQFGGLNSFLWTDPDDHTVTAHPFGLGDGSTAVFQLQRTLARSADLDVAAARAYWPQYFDGYEPVFDFDGTTSVYVDGSPATWATVGTYGAVTFEAGHEPAVGAVLTWTGDYYRRVRLAESAPTDRIASRIWECKSIQFISVKP